VEIQCDLYPNETLVLCKNPLQAAKSKQTRDELLAKADQKLDKIAAATRSTPRRLKDKILVGVRIEKALGKHRLKKFYHLEVKEGHFSYTHNTQAIQKAELLDGVYAIRSSVNKEDKDLVSDYKRLAMVEWAFRTMKSMSLRPIHHVKKERVIAHVFLCMLAYYVEYHLRKKLAPMLFAEEDPVAKRVERKSIVEPAKPSDSARKKASTKKTADGETAMSYSSVMQSLSGLCRLTGVPKIKTDNTPEVKMFEKELNSTQRRAFELLNIKLP